MERRLTPYRPRVRFLPILNRVKSTFEQLIQGKVPDGETGVEMQSVRLAKPGVFEVSQSRLGVPALAAIHDSMYRLTVSFD